MVPIIDIIIGVIMLIFLIMGLSRGFIKTVLALLGTILSLVLAYFLAEPFLNFINGIFDVTTPLNDTFIGWVEGWNPELLGQQIDPDTIRTQLVDFATSISLPETLYNPIVNAICNYIAGADAAIWQGKTIAGIIAPFFTNAILLTCSTLILFVLLRIALYLIEKIMDWTLLKINVFRALDRLLGLLFGAVQGLVVILLCFTLISFIATSPDSVVRQAINDSSVGKVIYEANPLPSIITQNLNLEQIIKNIFNPNGDEEEEDPDHQEQTPSDGDSEQTPESNPDAVTENTTGDHSEITAEDTAETETVRLAWQILPETAPCLF